MPNVVKIHEHQGKLKATDEFIVQRAAVIRALSNRVIGDIIEIGQLLTEVKQSLKHGEWTPWFEQNFKWTDRTAQKFMRVYDMIQGSKTEPCSDLNIDVSALYLLAESTTPKPVRHKVLELAANEPMPLAQVKEMVEAAREEAGKRSLRRWSIAPRRNGRCSKIRSRRFRQRSSG